MATNRLGAHLFGPRDDQAVPQETNSSGPCSIRGIHGSRSPASKRTSRCSAISCGDSGRIAPGACRPRSRPGVPENSVTSNIGQRPRLAASTPMVRCRCGECCVSRKSGSLRPASSRPRRADGRAWGGRCRRPCRAFPDMVVLTAGAHRFRSRFEGRGRALPPRSISRGTLWDPAVANLEGRAPYPAPVVERGRGRQPCPVSAPPLPARDAAHHSPHGPLGSPCGLPTRGPPSLEASTCWASGM